MFEKFPQLKRLERLLTKTQAFSPRKPRLSASEGPSAAILATRRATVLTVVWTQVVGSLALCPQDLLPLTQTQLKSLCFRQDDLGRTLCSRSCVCETFDNVDETCTPSKKHTAAAAKSLYDSDDLLEFKNPEDGSNRPTKKKSPLERKRRTW